MGINYLKGYEYVLLTFLAEFNSPASARANGVALTNTQTHKKSESSTSGRGVIPKARIKTIKMTLVIVLGVFSPFSPRYKIFATNENSHND